MFNVIVIRIGMVCAKCNRYANRWQKKGGEMERTGWVCLPTEGFLTRLQSMATIEGYNREDYNRGFLTLL